MAWNRGRNRKPWNTKWGMFARSRRGKIPTRKIPSSIARVRRQWVTIYNPMELCGTLFAPWTGQDPNACNPLRMTFNVIGMDQLEQDYGDNIKVVSQVGSFAFRPLYARPDRCSTAQLAAWRAGIRDTVIYGRWGLNKTRGTDASLGPNPHLDDSEDWSDTKLVRRGSVKWFPRPFELSNVTHPQQSFIGVYGDTQRSQYNTPATSSGSQPLFSVPAITTDCEPCFAGSEECLIGANTETLRDFPWRTLKMNSSKVIHLSEHDYLEYIFAFTNLIGTGDCGYTPGFTPCGMQVIPELKILIQYG